MNNIPQRSSIVIFMFYSYIEHSELTPIIHMTALEANSTNLTEMDLPAFIFRIKLFLILYPNYFIFIVYSFGWSYVYGQGKILSYLQCLLSIWVHSFFHFPSKTTDKKIISQQLDQMITGIFKADKKFTEEQMQNDSIYGILEVEKRQIQFNEDGTFKFIYHYYYEYENSFYVIETQKSNDVTLSGTVVSEGNTIVANITSGEQKAEDSVAKEVLGNANNITGKIVFSLDGADLNVTECLLEPETIYQAAAVISQGLRFIKGEN